MSTKRSICPIFEYQEVKNDYFFWPSRPLKRRHAYLHTHGESATQLFGALGAAHNAIHFSETENRFFPPD